MKLDEPIITSLLDNDLYKFNMGQLVFHDFSEAVVTYGFINRGKTQFPEGFAKALNWQIELLAVLKMVHSEKEYLRTIPGLRPSYIEWLSNYQFDPSEVVATQEGGDLSIFVKGSWFRTISWEVVLMLDVYGMILALAVVSLTRHRTTLFGLAKITKDSWAPATFTSPINTALSQ